MTNINNATEKTTLVADDELYLGDSQDVGANGKRLKKNYARNFLITTRQAANSAEGRTRMTDADINRIDSAVHNAIAMMGTAARPNYIGDASHPFQGWRETNYVAGGANHGGILLGYDNMNNQLMGVILGAHHALLADGGSASHGYLVGGSNSLVRTGDYAGGVGGTQNTADGDQATFVGGIGVRAKGVSAVTVGGSLVQALADNAGVMAARYAAAEGAASAVVGGQGVVTNTTLTAGVQEQATSIAVTAVPSDLAPGDGVRIVLNESLVHVTTVGGSYTSGLTVPLTDPILGDGTTVRADSGNVVSFMQGHRATGAQSVVLGGNENEATEIGTVSMGEDTQGSIRNAFFIGTSKVTKKGDVQGGVLMEKATTVGNDTSEDLVIASANDSRFNKWSPNVFVFGYAYVGAVAVDNTGSGGAGGLHARAVWLIPFSIIATGGTVGGTGYSDTVVTGTPIEVTNTLNIANAPTLDSNTAAAVRVNVNATPSAGTSGTIRWVAKLNIGMTHYD